MKKLFILFVLCAQFQMVHVHAAAVAGALEVTQLLNNAQLLGISISDGISAAATNADMIENIIQDPIANAMIAVAQEAAADSIISWINGGFDGQPLIIGNPESYIKNEGLKGVRQVLNNVPEGGIYSDSIFNAVLGQYQDQDLATQLTNLSSSNIPSLIQQNLCTEESLNALAINDVRDEAGNYNPEDLQARKQEIWDYACNGDPNSDKEVAARLSDLNTQNPNIGGWDSWLAMTGGDNEYTRSVKTAQLAAMKKEELERFANNEIYQGAGTISQKACLEYALTSEEGVDPVCIKEIVTNPGEAVQNALSMASTAGFERLANIMGAGSLVTALGTFAISKFTSGLNASFSQSTGITNVSSPVIGNQAPKQDLLSDSRKKEELLRPIMKQISAYRKSLEELNTTDRNYLADIAAYEARVLEGKACWDSINAGGQQAANAYALYQDRQTKINTTRAALNQELLKITEANALIETIIASLNASNSSQEIGQLFQKYSDEVDNKGLPTLTTAAERAGEYIRNKNQTDNDTELKNMNNQCTQIRNQSGGGL